MEDDRFKIFVYRLKEGESETISETFEPTFLQIEEQELQFEDPIKVEGKAYVSNNNFFLTLTVETEAMVPCAMCNEPTKVSVSAKHLVHTQMMDELKAGQFHMEEMIREGLLLEVPLKAECREGNCPERKHLEQYFSKEN